VRATLAASAAVGMVGSIRAATVEYRYDALGRLSGYTDPSTGQRVKYTYDANGNLTGVTVTAAPTIASFTPSCGVPGTSISIMGSGFGTGGVVNTVTINGIAATVTFTSATKLTVTQPSGATAGPIQVTLSGGGGSATSPTPYGGMCGPPTITSVNPSIGVEPVGATPGTTVTITGTNFMPTPSQNIVSFGVATASVGTASATSLVVTVPESATSGAVTVRTPYGVATAPSDFYVMPAGYATTSLDTHQRIASSVPVTIGAAGHVAVLLFDGTAGQRISALATPNVPWRLTLVGPYGPISVPNPPCGNSAAFIRATTLPLTGTYALVVDDPAGMATGSVTVNLYANVTDNTLSITPGFPGTPVTATTSTPGQMSRLNFTATAGQRVSVIVTVGTLGCCYNYASIVGPDGGYLHSPVKVDAGGFLDAKTIPAGGDGTYTVLLDASSNVGTATFEVRTVPADIVATLPFGGPTSMNLLAGQNAHFTFTGTAGQVVKIHHTGGAVPLGSDFFLMGPDGIGVAPPTTGDIGPVTLPQGGVYTLLVDPLGVSMTNESLFLTDCAGGGC